ncbi:hypothetical protein NA56DRAFT_661335 [Hyaloscypha hepaticicola]|uniref:CFEM domain-containing protein n=1 Tax=Hyaloscypha hepaticicola TaxID=2082293 RepID=A0A2J6PWN3_9HELO|nr:hypothetical protein NA56DRAFT_661335 [Hyaloscypha hepaticicola]
MKFSTSIVVSSLAALAQAQTACNSLTAAIPSCGVPCISSAVSLVGCAITDFACQCSSSQYAAINSAAQGCVLSNCQATAVSVLAAANAICTCASSAGSAGAGPTTSSSPVATSASAAAPSSTSSAPAIAATTTSSSTPAISGSGTTPQNTSSGLPPFTGGSEMLMPWVGAEIAVVVFFGGVMMLL